MKTEQMTFTTMRPSIEPLTTFPATCTVCGGRRQVTVPVTFHASDDFWATCEGQCKLKRWNKVSQDVEQYGHRETLHRVDPTKAKDKL